ncbi:hypothetical protein ACVWWG_000103 [Bradyrhizobium sp. LB7.2]
MTAIVAFATDETHQRLGQGEMQLIATRRYDDWHPVTLESFDLEDRMYRKPDGSFVLLVAGPLPEDPAIEQSYSLSGVFEWLSECAWQIERAVIVNESNRCPPT